MFRSRGLDILTRIKFRDRQNKTFIFNRNRSLLEIPYSCLSEILVTNCAVTNFAVTLVDSVSFIPKHCVPKVRKTFIRSMKEIVASPKTRWPGKVPTFLYRPEGPQCYPEGNTGTARER